jgi:hypothetical protein
MMRRRDELARREVAHRGGDARLTGRDLEALDGGDARTAGAERAPELARPDPDRADDADAGYGYARSSDEEG